MRKFEKFRDAYENGGHQNKAEKKWNVEVPAEKLRAKNDQFVI